MSRSKWLLINIQDPGIFDCQILNRDTWSDEAVKRFIQKTFVMLQLYYGTDSASEYTYVLIIPIFVELFHENSRSITYFSAC